MVRLAVLLAVAFLPELILAADSVPASPAPVFCGTRQWQVSIGEASRRFGIPETWVKTLIEVESAGCEITNGQPTTSEAGAMGLTQLMPEVWREYRDRLRLGLDPYDPRDNVLAGTAYLRDLYDRYGKDGIWAAYHAGPRRYQGWAMKGQALPAATVQYIARVRRLLGERSPGVAIGSVSDPTQFLRTPDPRITRDRATAGRRKANLFVRLKYPMPADDRTVEDSSDVRETDAARTD